MNIMQFLKQHCRFLIRKKWYSGPAILMLTAGIGTSLFLTSVTESRLFRQPTAIDPDGLFLVSSNLPRGTLSFPDYEDLSTSVTSIAPLFAFSQPTMATASVGGAFQALRCQPVSGNYFAAIGIRLSEGRSLTIEDDVVNGNPVAIVSAATARRLRINIGDTVTLNTRAFHIVGVLPPDFEPLERYAQVDIWIPIRQATVFRSAASFQNRGLQWVSVGGRVAGPTPDAEAELRVLGARLADENKTSNYGMVLKLISIREFRLLRDKSSSALLFLTVFGWLMLLISFSNFFTLTLLRLISRRQELSVRMALGAARFDVVRIVLSELILVIGISSLLGLAFAYLALQLSKLSPPIGDIIGGAFLRITSESLLSVVIGVVALTLLLGVLIVRWISRWNVVQLIREDASSLRLSRLFQVLLSLQLGLSMCLLGIALSCALQLRERLHQPLGFRTDEIVTLTLDIRALGHVQNRADTIKFLGFAVQRLGEAPGAVRAAASTSLPLDGASWTNLVFQGSDPTYSPDKNFAYYSVITSKYFETLGVNMREGREFLDTDITGDVDCVIINKTAAERYFPKGDAIGQSFKPWGHSRVLTVVGVAPDLPVTDLIGSAPQVYVPLHRAGEAVFRLIVQTRDSSPTARQVVARALGDLWPFSTPPDVGTLREQVAKTRYDLRVVTIVMQCIAVFSTGLSCTGFVLMSAYVARQNRRVSAIRLALGAPRVRMITDHLVRHAWALGGGMAVGASLLAIAYKATKAFPGSDIQLHIIAVVVCGFAALILSCVGLVIPVLRGTRLDISSVLREP